VMAGERMPVAVPTERLWALGAARRAGVLGGLSQPRRGRRGPAIVSIPHPPTCRVADPEGRSAIPKDQPVAVKLRRVPGHETRPRGGVRGRAEVIKTFDRSEPHGPGGVMGGGSSR